jgi:ATP/maltotriose-dependent transcriptional regulator MalT
LGRYEEAKVALDEAHSIAAGPDAGFKSQLAYVEMTGAQMALSLGNRAEATTRATAALTLAERDYKDTALQARQTLALIQAMSGASKQATTLVEEAVGAARELKLPRLLSTALLASADVRVTAGDARGALADAQAAQKMFASAGQLESEWRAWLVSARSVLLEGNSSTAYDYATRAESGRAALQARWGEDNYRGYVRRPDIQVRVKQLGQLLRTGGH